MAYSSNSHTLSPASDADVERQDQHSPPRNDGHRVTLVLASPCPNGSGPSQAKLTNPSTTIIGNSPIPPPFADGVDGPILASRPRGRPKGSKNKAKPPVYITKMVEPTMNTHVLEIAPGSDIVDMVHNFSLERNAGVNIINGVGRVRNVTIRNPLAHEPSIVLGGTHDLLLINGVHVGPATMRRALHTPQGVSTGGGGGGSGGSYSYFNGSHISYVVVLMVGSRGVVWGGAVMGKLVAASNVLLNVSTFADYEFHRLGFEDKPDHHQQGPNTSGVGMSTMKGLGPSLGPGPSTSGVVTLADNEPNWDSNLSARKQPHPSGNF